MTNTHVKFGERIQSESWFPKGTQPPLPGVTRTQNYPAEDRAEPIWTKGPEGLC